MTFVLIAYNTELCNNWALRGFNLLVDSLSLGYVILKCSFMGIESFRGLAGFADILDFLYN